MQKLRVVETQMDVMTHRHYWHSFLQHILGIELDLGKDVVYVSLQPYQQGYEKVGLKWYARGDNNGITEWCVGMVCSIVSYARFNPMTKKRS